MLVRSEELRYVVMNPDSGPGTVSYPSFVTQVAAARSQGATVIGYVDTSYGSRPLATVKADIDKYRGWYGVNAFFFDQTPYDCTEIAYYEDIETYVRAQDGGFIFHNPGMNPQECYLDVADVVVNFEGSESSYDAWTPAPYAAGYPADRFWHIVYSVDPAHAAALLSSAASRNGGLVYLTEQNMPNPFSVIPTDTLWLAQTPSRGGRTSAPQASAPTTTAPVSTPTRVAAPQSETPTTTSPAGAAAEAPVTTRPTVPSAPPVTTTMVPASPSAGTEYIPWVPDPSLTTIAPPTIAPTSASSSVPTLVVPAPTANVPAPTANPPSVASAPSPIVLVTGAPISGGGEPFTTVPSESVGPLVVPGDRATLTPGSRDRVNPGPVAAVVLSSTIAARVPGRPSAGPAMAAPLVAPSRVQGMNLVRPAAPTLRKVAQREFATQAKPTLPKTALRVVATPAKPTIRTVPATTKKAPVTPPRTSR